MTVRIGSLPSEQALGGRSWRFFHLNACATGKSRCAAAKPRRDAACRWSMPLLHAATPYRCTLSARLWRFRGRNRRSGGQVVPSRSMRCRRRLRRSRPRSRGSSCPSVPPSNHPCPRRASFHPPLPAESQRMHAVFPSQRFLTPKVRALVEHAQASFPTTANA